VNRRWLAWPPQSDISTLQADGHFNLAATSTPSRKLPIIGRLLSGFRNTVELLPDRSHRYGSEPFEPLKLVSDSPELTDGLDVLAMEHVPGKLR
jgi:hypothetical protein